MLRTGKFEVPYFIYDIVGEDIRTQILHLIENTQGYRSIKSYENLQKSDWEYNQNPLDFKKKYVDSSKPNCYNLLKPFIDTIIEDLNKFDKDSSLYVSQGWFNQYLRLNHFAYHWHLDTRWALVYYVEFSEDAPKTEFENAFGNPITVDVKQGDILIFPGWVKHRAPPNLSNNRKTIIAMNIAEEKKYEKPKGFQRGLD